MKTLKQYLIVSLFSFLCGQILLSCSNNNIKEIIPVFQPSKAQEKTFSQVVYKDSLHPNSFYIYGNTGTPFPDYNFVLKAIESKRNFKA